MADTIEKRVFDPEYLLAHLPEDLDARFAGADARVGARFDQLSIRLQTIETRVRHVEQAEANNGARLQLLDTRIGKLETGIAQLETRIGQLETGIGQLERGIGQMDTRIGRLEKAVGQVDTKLDEVLSRLAPKA
jgi:X-X-X-Leu-X-X-Gly heptad repeat protein